MTSINHTALASAVAIVSVQQETTAKVLILVALVASHVVTDAIPHCHFYDFSKLRKTWRGAMFELGGGFVILPALVLLLTKVDPI